MCVCVCVYKIKICDRHTFPTSSQQPMRGCTIDSLIKASTSEKKTKKNKTAHSPKDLLAEVASGEVSEEERCLSGCRQTGAPVFGFTTSVKNDTRSPARDRERN